MTRRYPSLLQAAADASGHVFNRLLNDWEAGEAHKRLTAGCIAAEEEKYGSSPVCAEPLTVGGSRPIASCYLLPGHKGFHRAPGYGWSQRRVA